MNYQHIARLAELANEVSDHQSGGAKFTTAVEFSTLPKTPHVSLRLLSWFPELTVASIQFDTREWQDNPYTTDELIQILEQIKACGFRDQQEKAA